MIDTIVNENKLESVEKMIQLLKHIHQEFQFLLRPMFELLEEYVKIDFPQNEYFHVGMERDGPHEKKTKSSALLHCM